MAKDRKLSVQAEVLVDLVGNKSGAPVELSQIDEIIEGLLEGDVRGALVEWARHRKPVESEIQAPSLLYALHEMLKSPQPDFHLLAMVEICKKLSPFMENPIVRDGAMSVLEKVQQQMKADLQVSSAKKRRSSSSSSSRSRSSEVEQLPSPTMGVSPLDMSDDSKVKKFIQQLEELKERTIVCRVDLDHPDGEKMLKEYVEGHKLENPGFKGSFNEFLKEKFKDKKEYQGKLVVAEVEGSFVVLGTSAQEERDNPQHKRCINIDGADFTGTSFTSVELGSSNGVSFRDCHFDRVTMRVDEAEQIDFRGSSMGECVFLSQSEQLEMAGCQLPFADPDQAQDARALLAYCEPQFRDLVDGESFRKKEKGGQDKAKAAIAGVPKQRKGWVEWGTLGWFGRGEFSLEDYATVQRGKVQEIKSAAEQSHVMRVGELQERCKVRFKETMCDPTYTPNQTPERANAERIHVTATREDLEEYKSSQSKKSFNEFMAERKGGDGIPKEAVVIADFEGADLSDMDMKGLDLNGTNLAYCKMKGCDASGASLIGACLEGAIFDDKTSFQGAKLVDANMVGASGEGVDFEKAIMIRTRMNCSNFPGAKMASAQMYAVEATSADFSSADMQHVEAQRGVFRGAVLRSVDARHVDMRAADLTGANLESAKLSNGCFDHATMTQVLAEKADLTKASMLEVDARFADFKEATLTEVIARGGDFTDADLSDIKAKHADFTEAKLEEVNARMADLEGAILIDAKARAANFEKACLEEVKGARIDLRDAVLARAKAAGADFTAAAMQRVEAYKVDLTGAILREANLEKANLTAANLKEAVLERAKAKGAILIRANMEGADVTGMSSDETTLLWDANLRGIIGDDKNALHDLQKDQHGKLKELLGISRYGHCQSMDLEEMQLDGSAITVQRNDRFECQRLGAQVLGIAIGGGAGVVMAGHFTGLAGATVGALVAGRALEAIRKGCCDDLGYLNNVLGDKLAEIGAVAAATGVGAADKAIDGGAAALICTSLGIVKGAAMTAVGGLGVYGGVRCLWSGHKTKSRFKKIAGSALTLAGGACMGVGLLKLGRNLRWVGYGVVAGSVAGGSISLGYSIQRLWAYQDATDGKYPGARPEDIYRESREKGAGILRKIMPTTLKLVLGATFAVAFAVAAYLLVTSVLPVVGLAKLFTVGAAMIPAATAGFLGGYLFDNKVVAAIKWCGRKTTPSFLHERIGLALEKGHKKIRRVHVVESAPEKKVKEEGAKHKEQHPSKKEGHLRGRFAKGRGKAEDFKKKDGGPDELQKSL